MKKPFKLIMLLISIPVVALLIITIIYYSFLFIAHDFNPDFLKIDDCLDAGRVWNYDTANCEK